ncbi:hypothetical protein MNEG_14845 [Monoraphidium neglectum]|uniref:Uncharacterized protein n=1 Tax=Monoraphidium neglectum TaxID=145388 RepID=A0A0D2IZ38_9CHLO|nr:hypothetical protein MNEG_14845 [Monoraphidium neglectum]KIY93117.1 hypothetical protein MNEG_14845 [Monoraphidium neglectum]|eukprot:XP_013892137.1 hypothetical protein MNEG_14845 [Monoraphidium neglectum]
MGRLLSLTAARLAPTLAGAAPGGALFDVACWGYWNGSLAANASIGADPSYELTGGASMSAGGTRIAAVPPSPSAVAAVGVPSLLTQWQARGAEAAAAALAARGGGVDWGEPGRGAYAVAPDAAYGGGDAGLLRLLVLEWRGVQGGTALWVADERGPWELEPGTLWVPPVGASVGT